MISDERAGLPGLAKPALRDSLAAALASLGVDARPDDATLLSGPHSGTHTYLVRRASGDLVLKIADADAPDHVRARALREARFFAELAPRLPLRTPRLLAATTDGAVVLLFAAHRPTPPAPRWPLAWYDALAADLADLHASFRDNAALDQLDWLKPAAAGTAPEPIEAAQAAWVDLLRQEHLADLLPPTVMSRLERLLHSMAAVDRACRALPTCLCHGDCHAGNLLLDSEVSDGRFIWADWQEVGRGRGPEELSFFVQRAMTDGAAVLEAQLVAAYHQRLAARVGAVSVDGVETVVRASELRTRLLDWPHYLAHLPPGATALSLRRILDAAARLGI